MSRAWPTYRKPTSFSSSLQRNTSSETKRYIYTETKAILILLGNKYIFLLVGSVVFVYSELHYCTWNIVVEEMHCSTVSWTCDRVVRFIHYITWQCIRAVMILYCNTLHNTIIHWTSFALQEPVHHSSDENIVWHYITLQDPVHQSSDEIPQGSEQSLLSALGATAEGNSQPDLTKIIIQHTNTLLKKNNW